MSTDDTNTGSAPVGDSSTVKQRSESAAQAVPPAPAGFRPMQLGANPFLQVNGPLHGKLDGQQFVLGLRIERRHCNPAGYCHGGMLLTFADMTLIFGSNVQSGVHRYMTTVNLSTDFIRAAPEGGWLEGRTQVLRITRNLVFSQALLSVDGELAARISGILKPTGEPDPLFSAERYFAAG
jgi:uncharacterized protein (TIGR00369 family)